MDVFSQEFLVGAIAIAWGSIILKLQQYEWYREKYFSGWWKAYNTPSGMFWANLQCSVIVLVGIALCIGLVKFGG